MSAFPQATPSKRMNPLRWSFRSSFFAGFVACVALLGFALYTERAWGLIPCPLCIFQRIAFIVMAMCFLIGALHAPRAGSRWIYAGGVLLGAVAGIVVATRHLWLQSLPADRVPACGPGLDYMVQNFPLGKTLAMVLRGSGECAENAWQFLGLGIAAWALVWFALLAALSVYLVWRPAR
jgi:disulfide bond formation protein DsbB